MKRVIAAILTLAILCMPILSVAAADPLTFTIDSASAKLGEKVTLNLTISNNPGVMGMAGTITYDKENLEFTNMTLGSKYFAMGVTFSGAFVEEEDGDNTVLVKKSDGFAYVRGGNTSLNDVFLTLEFTVKNNAKPGTYTIGFAGTPNNSEAVANKNDEYVPFTVVEGKITVTCEHKYGEWEKNDADTHKKVCSACGDVQTEAHTWDNGEVTTAPSHVAEGVKTYTCTVCAQTKTEPVAKTTDHAYGEWQKHNANQHKRVCPCEDVQYEDHKWDAGKVTTSPTCKDTGVKTYTCSVCGETKTETVAVDDTAHKFGEWSKLDAANHKHTCSVCGKEFTEAHKWDEGKVTTLPTHTATGVKTYTCSVCGETKTETVAKLVDHSYGEWVKHNANQHKRSCVCGETQYENHTWDAGKVTTAATCKDAGVKTYTCTACGETKTEAIAKLTTHTYGEYVDIEANKHKRTCTVCGAEEITEHVYDAGEVTKAATCKETGVRKYTCIHCGHIANAVIDKLNTHTYGEYVKVDAESHKRTCTVCGVEETKAHTFDEGKITTPATCKATGVKTYTCSACGETKTEEVPQTKEHKFGEWKKTDKNMHTRVCTICGEKETAKHAWDSGMITQKATCKSMGTMVFTCKVCGAEDVQDVPKTKQHKVGEWTLVKAATCTEDGSEQTKCTICGQVVETRTIAKKSHNLAEWAIAKQPTCTEEGERTRSCTVCGEVVSRESIPAKGHTFGEWKMTKAPTENAVGEISRVCECGFKEAKTVEKLTAKVENGTVGASVEGKLPDKAVFASEDLGGKLTESEKKNMDSAVFKLTTDSSVLGYYALSLQFDNITFQPMEAVKVSLPIPADMIGKFEEFTVYYIDDNGVAHKMVTEVVGDMVVFETDHFSNYVVVGTGAVTTPEETTATTTDLVPETTKTPDPVTEPVVIEPTESNNAVLFIVIGVVAVAAIAVVVVLVLKKKKEA